MSKRKLDNPAGHRMAEEGSSCTHHTGASSPTVASFTTEPSLLHTEESNEVAQINDSVANKQVFQLDFTTEMEQRFVNDPVPRLLSIDSDLPAADKERHSSTSLDTTKAQASSTATLVPCFTVCKKDAWKSPQPHCFYLGTPSPLKKARMEVEEGKQTNSGTPTAERTTKEAGTNAALDANTESGAADRPAGKKGTEGSEAISGCSVTTGTQAGLAVTQAGDTPSVGGYMAVAGKNGEPLMHPLLPPVIPHPPSAAGINPCVPAEGSWYQIVPTALPAVCGNHTQTALCTSSSSLLSNGPVNTTSNCTTQATPTTHHDPLFGFLQQFTGSSQDMLRLPVSVNTGTPQFLYAPHPRTGQLLLVSPVSDITSMPAFSPHPAQQPVNQSSVLQPQQQQQQQQHLPFLQLQQPPQTSQQPQPFPVQLMANRSKSPLKDNQQQTVAPVKSTPGSQERSKGGEKSSFLSQLLSNRSPANSTKEAGTNRENMPPVAAAQELLSLSSPARVNSKKSPKTTAPPPLFQSSPRGSDEEPVRENHNMKERRRRARIKEACDLMRELVPGMSEKTDKATVFEFSARYIHFLKSFVGCDHDKDFLIKYSPY